MTDAARTAPHAGRLSIAIRFARVVLHLLRGLAISAFIFPWADTARREQCVRRWSAGLLAILRVRVRAIPDGAELPAQAALVIANHISWLDIFVINALQPCRFVAKADIRSWPVLGWLCAKSGTIFIARGKQREVRRVYQGLVGSLQAGERIAFFPEGTTAAQGTLLPFHANLFEAAIEARVPVQPCALRYLDHGGELHRAADFIGDTSFVDSLMMILAGGPMTAEIQMLPVISAEAAHRRELAVQARAAVASALRLE
ncbi:MAG TPA: lysophospholipid acyltransferase family protein [Oxalicibacterium sp.]|nr:lysophospholipid acyltransferase family protein [Oxalicibacterium sp.]